MKNESTTSSSLGLNTFVQRKLDKRKLLKTYSVLQHALKLKDINDPKLMTVVSKLAKKGKYVQ